MFWSSVQILSETFLTVRRTMRDIINVLRSLCKHSVILCKIKKNLKFLDRFSKNTQIPKFMKILLVEAVLFHADGRRDRTKLIVAFGNCREAPKN